MLEARLQEQAADCLDSLLDPDHRISDALRVFQGANGGVAISPADLHLTEALVND